MIHISIASDFSDVPWGRVPSDGDFCGENFRRNYLVPALERGEKVTISLDGIEGVGSSFLDEAFGGLVRKEGFSVSDLRSRLVVVTKERPFQMYVDLIWRYITEAGNHRQLARA